MTESLEIEVGANRALIRMILTMLAKNGTILGQDIASFAQHHSVTEPEEFLSGDFLSDRHIRNAASEEALRYLKLVMGDARGLPTEERKKS
jgi:hypothetical protein